MSCGGASVCMPYRAPALTGSSHHYAAGATVLYSERLFARLDITATACERDLPPPPSYVDGRPI